MRNILTDTQERLRSNAYKNEEHVRLSLVGRIVQRLGWDIWHPPEVNTEFNAIPHEDKTRVDMALFLPPWKVPSVFIEIKAVGKMLSILPEIEKQTRDYNRNNTAPISIITDGQHWKFYLSQTAGEFSQKCFETIDLLDESRSIEELENSFTIFLSREEIRNENAINQALIWLKRTQKEKRMYELLPIAKKDAETDPSKSWLEFFVTHLKDNGINLSNEEAIEFIKNHITQPTTVTKSTLAPESNSRNNLPTIPQVISSGKKLHLTGKNCDAYGYHFPPNELLVLKGSRAVKDSLSSLTEKNRRIKNDLISEGIFIIAGDNLELTQDHKFDSPSQAASIFTGRSADGNKEWR